jgi:hypothetical protein
MFKDYKTTINRESGRLFATIIILLIGVVGMSLIILSHAASPYTSTEASTGVLSGSAKEIAGNTASSGDPYVEFEASTSTGSEGDITGVPAGITPGSAYEDTFEAMSATEQVATIAQMKADGVQWLRFDANIGYPDAYDTFIKDAVNGGIKVDVALDGDVASPSQMTTFAQQTVAYYEPQGVYTYEILNEPNGCEVAYSAVAYTAILQAAYTAIKAAQPSAFVLAGGLCPAGGDDEPYTYLAAMYAAGAHGYFDAMNMHPYSSPDTPDDTGDSWNPWSYLGQLRSVMDANGDSSKQIWLTEFGCPTGGPPPGWDSDQICTNAGEAQQITEAFASARATSGIGPLFIFNWDDSGDGDFGLFTSDGVAKPDVLSAYEQAAGVN